MIAAAFAASLAAVPALGQQPQQAKPPPTAPAPPRKATTEKEDLRGRSTMSREQGKGAPTGQAEAKGLRSNEVERTQLGQPTQQGPRSPELQQTQASDNLFAALAAVRNAPPTLDGTPMPRPNPLGSEPEMIEDPSRSPNPSDQTSREIK